MKYLYYNSSSIDWCEDNFTYSPYIAEFYNSFSNIFYIIIYYSGLHSVRNIYCKDYDKKLFSMLLFTGICSFYFHATLSLLGQIMDELCILFVLSQSLLLLYKRDQTICYIIYYLTAILSVIMFLYPKINIPILFCYGMFMKKELEEKMVICKKEKFFLWKNTKILFFLSLLCWFS